MYSSVHASNQVKRNHMYHTSSLRKVEKLHASPEFLQGFDFSLQRIQNPLKSPFYIQPDHHGLTVSASSECSFNQMFSMLKGI